MSFFHPKAGRTTEDPDSFQPEYWLTGIILRSRSPFSVVHELHGVLYIDPQRQCFNGPRSILPELCSTPASELTVRPLRDWPGNAQNLPLEELLWASAWYACEGLLPAGASRHDVIGLRHWPNLTRLPGTPDLVRLCALLSRKAHSLHLARKLLAIDEPLACRFYSAAWYAGMLDRISHQHDAAQLAAIESVSEHPGLGRVLQQLWQRLAGA